jgi:hypothetical protein
MREYIEGKCELKEALKRMMADLNQELILGLTPICLMTLKS